MTSKRNGCRPSGMGWPIMLGKRVNEAPSSHGKMFQMLMEVGVELLSTNGAVILSAQTTDKAINKITPGLWAVIRN